MQTVLGVTKSGRRALAEDQEKDLGGKAQMGVFLCVFLKRLLPVPVPGKDGTVSVVDF